MLQLAALKALPLKWIGLALLVAALVVLTASPAPVAVAPIEEAIPASAKSALFLQKFSTDLEPAVDAMIDALLNARDRPAFEDAVRAYDRVLLSGAWVVPLYHQPEQWVARWNHIGRPDKTPLTGYQLTTWWRQP